MGGSVASVGSDAAGRVVGLKASNAYLRHVAPSPRSLVHLSCDPCRRHERTVSPSDAEPTCFHVREVHSAYLDEALALATSDVSAAPSYREKQQRPRHPDHLGQLDLFAGCMSEPHVARTVMQGGNPADPRVQPQIAAVRCG